MEWNLHMSTSSWYCLQGTYHRYASYLLKCLHSRKLGIIVFQVCLFLNVLMDWHLFYGLLLNILLFSVQAIRYQVLNDMLCLQL